MLNILSYEFMQNAVMTAVIVSVICGLIGPFIVTKRMVALGDHVKEGSVLFHIANLKHVWVMFEAY